MGKFEEKEQVPCPWFGDEDFNLIEAASKTT